jgi:hypothetical protein
MLLFHFVFFTVYGSNVYGYEDAGNTYSVKSNFLSVKARYSFPERRFAASMETTINPNSIFDVGTKSVT